MKRVGFLIEKIASLDNLYLAYQKAAKGKYRKKEVLCFSEHFDEYIQQIRTGILEGSLTVGNYHYFTIHDPKERVICATPFRDRLLHHAIMNVCHDYFDRTLIDGSYATRRGKGVYSALDAAQLSMAHYQYSAKLDVRKYFDSISHEVLKCQLRRLFKDNELVSLFDKIIDSYSVDDDKGLPIGNLTSQYFANLYLSSLDHYAKEILHIPCYIRYMDDILIVHNDKSELKRCVDMVKEFSFSKLNLLFKPPVCRNNHCGQTFLGYRVMPNFMLLSGRSKKRFRSKLLDYNKYVNSGIWSESEYSEHILPLLSFAKHAESRLYRKSCLNIIR